MKAKEDWRYRCPVCESLATERAVGQHDLIHCIACGKRWVPSLGDRLFDLNAEVFDLKRASKPIEVSTELWERALTRTRYMTNTLSYILPYLLPVLGDRWLNQLKAYGYAMGYIDAKKDLEEKCQKNKETPLL